MEVRSHSLPILATLVSVERTTFGTRLRVTKLWVLCLTLVLLRLLNLRAIAGPSEPSAASTVEGTSGSGLLASTEATRRTALSNPDVLSSANSAHIFARTTVCLKRSLGRSTGSLVHSLWSTSTTSSGVRYTRGLTQATHEALESWIPVQLLVLISWKSASNALVLVVVSNIIIRTRRVLLIIRVLTVWIGMLDVRRGLFSNGGTGGGPRRTGLEHLRVLDERLGNTVSRIVGRSVVLVLIREIMVRDRVGVTLLWTLATSRWRLIACLAGLLG
jgi:hypothetical protein